MRFRQILLYGLFAFVSRSAEPQVPTAAAPLSAACIRLNHDALARVARGQSAEAESLLFAALAGSGGQDRVCAGVVMYNIAALLMVSGRMEEAEAMAERSVRTLEDCLPPGDPGLLRPLQILAATRFEQGKTGKAREAYRKMEAIRTTWPEDRWLVHAMAGPLLVAELKIPEAESEYFAAFQALKELGRGETADAATLLENIGALYVRENRMREACEMLDQAFAVFGRAADTVPWDRGKLLHIRGALYGREGQWKAAGQDLADALAIADQESRVEPAALRSLLDDYATVLRKSHRRRDARSIERRIAALGRAPEDREVVDVTDLLARPKARR
jgi:tetratricopeptide (TPR) repeat protein